MFFRFIKNRECAEDGNGLSADGRFRRGIPVEQSYQSFRRRGEQLADDGIFEMGTFWWDKTGAWTRQGMMFGAVAATALTLIAVPLLYYEFFKEKACPLRAEEFELKAGEKEPEKDEN